MKNILFFFIFISPMLALAQPYEIAPKTSKKIHRITEWVSPSLKAKGVKGMMSTFDRRGYLISYTSNDPTEVMNTVNVLDKKGRVLERLEGKGNDQVKSSFKYTKGKKVIQVLHRGKHNRTVEFYNKKGEIEEQKSYAKGLELGNSFRLKERVFYKYNRRGQLVTEIIYTYEMPKSKKYNTRKKVYNYHPQSQRLIKTIKYDYDGSPSVVEDIAHYKDGKEKSIITNYLKDKTVSTKEFLYKKGKIWQRITTERGIRHIEVFVDGRLIRLRSYNDEKIYRVVDYQYEYY